MEIKKLDIKNYRSIKHLEIEPSNLCALIGANSTGKSNVLKALNILLGETWPTERAFSIDDFYNRNSSAVISIQVWFSNKLPGVKLTPKGGREKQFAEIISFRLEHTKDPEASYPTTFTAIDEQGKEYYGSGDVRDKVSFIYLPSERELNKQFNTSQWTLLGKILTEVDKNFRTCTPETSEDPDVVKHFIESMAEPRKILESDFSDKLTFSKFKETFTTHAANLASGLAQNVIPQMEIYDPLYFFKTIELVGSENDQTFNVDELGSGVQNLILLALLQTYAELMKKSVILAIEEPETYLYPQAQRNLYSIFKSLSSNTEEKSSTQIFYTTHNPNFVDASRPNDLVLLRKSIEKGTYKCENEKGVLNADEYYKVYTNFNTERNELFFANKVLLVEGASDKIFWSTFSEEKCSIDLDKLGISIIECNGKAGVIYFIGVCRLAGIENFFAVWDQDNKDSDEIKDKYGNLTYALQKNKGLEIPKNLESALNISGKEKVKNAFIKAQAMTKDDLPKNLLPIIDFLRN